MQRQNSRKSKRIQILGITVDKNSNRKEHLNNTTENCYATLNVLSKSKRYIQLPESKQLAESLISSRLDYCNELLFDIPKYMKKKQRTNCSYEYLMNFKGSKGAYFQA